jgi:predicted dehydrogenase
MVGFQKRFAGVFARTKELLSKGAIGEPFLFRSHHFGSSVTTNNEGWKFQGGSGGATLEFGVHLLDLLIWFFGEPTSVESSKKSIFSSSVEDYVVSHTTFQNDLSGSVEIGWSMRNYAPDQIMIEIHGRNGTLNVTEDRLKIYVDSSVENVVEEGIHEYTSFELDPVVPFLLAHPENVAQEEHFLKCVQGRDKPTTSFEDAAKVNRFVDMILSK